MSCPASGDATDLEGSSQPVILVSGTTAEQRPDILILQQSPVSWFKNGPTIRTGSDGLGHGPRNVNFNESPLMILVHTGSKTRPGIQDSQTSVTLGPGATSICQHFPSQPCLPKGLGTSGSTDASGRSYPDEGTSCFPGRSWKGKGEEHGRAVPAAPSSTPTLRSGISHQKKRKFHHRRFGQGPRPSQLPSQGRRQATRARGGQEGRVVSRPPLNLATFLPSLLP